MSPRDSADLIRDIVDAIAEIEQFRLGMNETGEQSPVRGRVAAPATRSFDPRQRTEVPQAILPYVVECGMASRALQPGGLRRSARLICERDERQSAENGKCDGDEILG